MSARINRAEQLNRFFAHVECRTDGCWIWTGPASGTKGYGSYRGQQAHRWAYKALTGLVLVDELQLHHTCEVKQCVNPDHLVPLTCAEHLRLHADKQTHCKHGHEFTPENTYVQKSGTRACRECRRGHIKVVSLERSRRRFEERVRAGKAPDPRTLRALAGEL